MPRSTRPGPHRAELRLRPEINSLPRPPEPAAVMSKRLRIPTYHREAGNRCFDENVPEETNRRLVDHVADFNLVYTEHARRNLLAEGLPPRRILLTGSPMREVLEHFRPRIEASDVLDRLRLQPGRYF